MAVWTTLPFLVLGAGGLTIDTTSPDALCPPLEQTRSIVEARLGDVELEGTWRATYVLVHRAEGDRVTLRLFDPAGAVRLEREFVAEGGGCSTLAQVIALVLERYFLRPESTLESEPSSVAGPTAPLSPSPSSSQTTASYVRLIPVGSPAVETRSVARSHYVLDAGLWASTAWLAPSVGVAFRSSERWSLGLGAGYDLSDHESRVATGWGHSRRFPLWLQAQRQLLQAGPLRLQLGAEMLGLVERVQTTGLFENGAASRLVPGVGLRLGAELLPGRSMMGPFVEFSSAILMRWLTTPFEVDHEPAFVLPTFVLGLHFGIRTIL